MRLSVCVSVRARGSVYACARMRACVCNLVEEMC